LKKLKPETTQVQLADLENQKKSLQLRPICYRQDQTKSHVGCSVQSHKRLMQQNEKTMK
jgi:hypothetical protein